MNNELIAILDYLERDRGIDRDVLTTVIEESLVTAARKAIGPANELRVHLDPKTGDIQALAKLQIVEHVEHPEREIDIAEARTKIPDANVGDELDWEVTPKNFGRIAAQTAKQGIMQRLREAEKSRIREDFTERIGEILYGAVTRFEKGDIIIAFGRAEGTLRAQDKVPNEDYRVGDHICCVLTDVNANRHGPVLIVSRTAPELVRLLFEREVTEIAENIVEIKEVAREPGYRSKIAVYSKDPSVDPVGACVGIRGSRVKTIVKELNGEKVDIVRWDPDLSTFITNALQPAEIKSLEFDEDNKKVEIVVDQDQLSLAIGKRGQNARLSAKLTGCKIDIKKFEDKKAAGFEEKIQQAISNLASAPGISPELAEILVHNGFLSSDGIKAADVADIAAIDGIDQETAEQVKRAFT
jgi:transcription termination/antitermination protein NusA